MPVFISLRLREEGSFCLIFPFQESPPGPPAGLLLLLWSSSQSQLHCMPWCVQGTAGFYSRWECSESGTRSASPPRGARETQGFSRPGYCPQPHPQAGYTQEQTLGYQAGWTSRPSGPGLGGAKVMFPRTSRGGCFACQSLTPPVQTVSAKHISPQSIRPAEFALASPQSQALHRFQPVPLSPLASQASRLRLQGLRLSQGLGLNQNQTEKRKEAQLLSGLLSDFYRPQTNEPHSHSWPDMNLTPHLSLAFISPCFL